MTQSQIQALIEQIVTAGDYTADEMRPLLTDILAAAYGPMYMGSVAPGVTQDETFGYRPGSIGYDTQTQRYYVCQSALAGNAVWLFVPVDSKFENVAYTDDSQVVSLQTNTNVAKVSTGTYDSCILRMPSSPFAGKTVVVYFSNPQTQFTFTDSNSVIVNGGNVLTIPAGQQFTFSYSGTAWEIVGVNNSTAGTPSGVDIELEGTNVVSDTTFINFTGAVNVTPSTTGVDVDVLTNAGVDVTGGTTGASITGAQAINLSNNFTATPDGSGGADLSFVSRIAIQQDGVNVTGGSSTIGGFNFIGPMFYETPVYLTGSIANIVLNGPKPWVGTGFSSPGATNDITEGYSIGSVGRNTGSLLRTYICRDNTTGAAVWDQITLDYKTEQFAMTSGGTVTLANNTANVILTTTTSISNYTIYASAYPYEGKTLTIYATTTVGQSINQITLRSPGGSQGTVFATLGLGVNTATVSFVCTNASTQEWKLIGKGSFNI